MKKILLFVILFVLSFSQESFASNSGVFSASKTIKDLKKDIKIINKEEADAEIRFKKFLDDHKIDSYLKNPIANVDIQNMKNIVINYVSNASYFENKIKKSQNEEEILSFQKSILDLRKDLYKDLLPYIDNKKYKDYINYIENNTKNLIEKNSLYINKFKAQLAYNKKLDILEKKIQENRDYLDEIIKNLVEQRFDEKFSQLIDSPNFVKLSNESKIKTLERVIWKLTLKIDSFKSNLDYESIYIEADVKKLEIYKILIQKLREVTYNIK